MEQELRFGLDLGQMADFPAFIASKCNHGKIIGYQFWPRELDVSNLAIENWLCKLEFYNFWLLLLNWLQDLKFFYWAGCWLLVWGLNKSLLECATVWIKSEVILPVVYLKIVPILSDTKSLYIFTKLWQNSTTSVPPLRKRERTASHFPCRGTGTSGN